MCVSVTKLFALLGNGPNLEAISFTEQVVGYQQCVIELMRLAIYLTAGMKR